jgi:hypothetical protein
MAIENAASLLARALNALSTGTGTLQARLETACTYSFIHVVHESGQEDYLPEDVQQRIRVLMDRLTSVAGEGGTGDIRATVSRMSDDEAQECATEMTELAPEVAMMSVAQHPEWYGGAATR